MIIPNLTTYPKIEVQISKRIRKATKQAKVPTVFKKNDKASCLLFSRKRRAGSYTNKIPMILTDSTSRLSIVIGASKVSF